MFTSYDKNKFIVGAEYYTYYLRSNNRGNGLKDYTGIMKVEVVSNDPTQYSPEGYTRFRILESKKLSDTMEGNIHVYMNGYGMAFTRFFETYDECVKDHDDTIKEFAKDQNTADREKLYKKLIVKDTPKVSRLESESVAWYKSLSRKEKLYVQWLKEYYSDI